MSVQQGPSVPRDVDGADKSDQEAVDYGDSLLNRGKVNCTPNPTRNSKDDFRILDGLRGQFSKSEKSKLFP